MHRFAPVSVLLLIFLLVSATVTRADVLEVSFDIKPTSCPNPLNPPDELFVPVLPTAILGTKDLSASSIDVGSLVIVVPGGGGFGEILIPPIGGGGIEDVATPVEDNSDCQCTEEGPDGFLDLTVHFDKDKIAKALGEVYPGQEIELCIRGALLDESKFEGCDCIVIVGPVSVDSGTWGRVKASYRD